MGDSFASSVTDKTGVFSFDDEEEEEEEEEENSTSYDQSFFGSSSGSSCSCADSINRVCLNFTKRTEEHPSKVTKCKAFWQYVDSRPDLEQLKVLGWPEKEKHSCHCSRSVSSSTTSVSSCNKNYFWLRHLLDLKSKGLDQVALAGEKSEKSDSEAGHHLYADRVEETPSEMNREIKQFEKILAVTMSTRDRYADIRRLTAPLP